MCTQDTAHVSERGEATHTTPAPQRLPGAKDPHASQTVWTGLHGRRAEEGATRGSLTGIALGQCSLGTLGWQVRRARGNVAAGGVA